MYGRLEPSNEWKFEQIVQLSLISQTSDGIIKLCFSRYDCQNLVDTNLQVSSYFLEFYLQPKEVYGIYLANNTSKTLYSC